MYCNKIWQPKLMMFARENKEPYRLQINGGNGIKAKTDQCVCQCVCMCFLTKIRHQKFIQKSHFPVNGEAAISDQSQSWVCCSTDSTGCADNCSQTVVQNKNDMSQQSICVGQSPEDSWCQVFSVEIQPDHRNCAWNIANHEAGVPLQPCSSLKPYYKVAIT